MIPDIVTCTYNKIQSHEQIQSDFAIQFEIWKTNIVNKYFFVKLLQSNNVTIRLIDYYTKDTINGVRLANYFIYLQDNIIYTQKLENYVMMIPIQMFNSYDDFQKFDIAIASLIQSLTKYIINDDPSPILMCNIIDLDCTLSQKYPKTDSEQYFNSLVDPIVCHVENTTIHVCSGERTLWNQKITETCAKNRYALKEHLHDYAVNGLQSITVNNIQYCSIGKDYFTVVGFGLTVNLCNSVISFTI